MPNPRPIHVNRPLILLTDGQRGARQVMISTNAATSDKTVKTLVLYGM